MHQCILHISFTIITHVLYMYPMSQHRFFFHWLPTQIMNNSIREIKKNSGFSFLQNSVVQINNLKHFDCYYLLNGLNPHMFIEAYASHPKHNALFLFFHSIYFAGIFSRVFFFLQSNVIAILLWIKYNLVKCKSHHEKSTMDQPIRLSFGIFNHFNEIYFK